MPQPSGTLPATTTTTTTIATTTKITSIRPSSYSTTTSVPETSTQVQQGTTPHSTAVISGGPSPTSSTQSDDNDNARDIGSSQGSEGLDTKDMLGIVFGIVGAIGSVVGGVLAVMQYRKRERVRGLWGRGLGGRGTVIR